MDLIQKIITTVPWRPYHIFNPFTADDQQLIANELAKGRAIIIDEDNDVLIDPCSSVAGDIPKTPQHPTEQSAHCLITFIHTDRL
jgi:hypothetical protein